MFDMYEGHIMGIRMADCSHSGISKETVRKGLDECTAQLRNSREDSRHKAFVIFVSSISCRLTLPNCFIASGLGVWICNGTVYGR